VTPIVLGLFVWAGLFLRDERIRMLLPLRSWCGRYVVIEARHPTYQQKGFTADPKRKE
jgi:hypothetical protein